MKKLPPSRPPSARARKGRTTSRPSAGEPASDAIDNTPDAPGRLGRTDIERPSDPPRMSIEGASRPDRSEGVEAPASPLQEEKASPFE